jgi:hypothetical protein
MRNTLVCKHGRDKILAWQEQVYGVYQWMAIEIYDMKPCPKPPAFLESPMDPGFYMLR